MAVMSAIGDLIVENGLIEMDYDGTGGTNAGLIFRIGSRNGYKWGQYTNGVEEEDLPTPMGNVTLRNLRLKTNNPAVVGNVLIGGLRNTRIENVTFDGQGAAPDGFYYEYGEWHFESSAANIKSSHATNLYFGNIDIKNLATGGSDGSGIGIVGAASAIIENVRIDTAKNGIQFRPGEALYYNPGTPDSGLVKRCITLRNIQAKNIIQSGIALIAAESNASGYLSGVSLTDAQQRDLMRFSVDGAILSAGGAGIYVNGPCDIRNVTLNGTATSGQLQIGDDCIRGVFTNVEVLNGASTGVRANMGDTISGMTPRLKTLTFTECRVAGNTTGYVFANTKSVRIMGGRIGYQSAVDGQGEDPTTGQGICVSVDQTANGGGVYCYGVDTTPKTGSVAYSMTGTVTNPCGVYNPRGTISYTGAWEVDGMAVASAAQLADKTDPINTAGKYLYRRVIENSNNRIYFASGTNATDGWKLADGSATVTPA